MKALRISCFMSAVYYFLHMSVLYFNSLMAHFTSKVMPLSAVNDNPVLKAQYLSNNISQPFIIWLVAGIAVCLLLGFFTKALWNAIPVIAVLLFAGSLAWVIIYYQAMQPYYTELGNLMQSAPGMMGSYLKNSISASQSASLYPVLVPGFVIFLFWWKSRKEAPQQKVY